MLRVATAGALLASMVGCTTLKPMADGNTYVSTARPSQVWVSTDDGTVLLDAPRLLGDTLVGFVAGEYREFLPGGVREVSVRQPAPRRTLLLAGGMVLGSAVLIATLSDTGPSASLPTPEEDPTNPRP
jgi:hypothetical protein